MGASGQKLRYYSVPLILAQVEKFRAVMEDLLGKFSYTPTRRVAEGQLSTWIAGTPSTSQADTPRTVKRKWTLSRKCARVMERICEVAMEEQVCQFYIPFSRFSFTVAILSLQFFTAGGAP